MLASPLYLTCVLAVAERLSESVHVADHDPSMALYRLQEHIHKVAPQLVARKYSNLRLNACLQHACCDLENSNKYVRLWAGHCAGYCNIAY